MKVSQQAVFQPHVCHNLASEVGVPGSQNFGEESGQGSRMLHQKDEKVPQKESPMAATKICSKHGYLLSGEVFGCNHTLSTHCAG